MNEKIIKALPKVIRNSLAILAAALIAQLYARQRTIKTVADNTGLDPSSPYPEIVGGNTGALMSYSLMLQVFSLLHTLPPFNRLELKSIIRGVTDYCGITRQNYANDLFQDRETVYTLTTQPSSTELVGDIFYTFFVFSCAIFSELAFSYGAAVGPQEYYTNMTNEGSIYDEHVQHVSNDIFYIAAFAQSVVILEFFEPYFEKKITHIQSFFSQSCAPARKAEEYEDQALLTAMQEDTEEEARQTRRPPCAVL